MKDTHHLLLKVNPVLEILGTRNSWMAKPSWRRESGRWRRKERRWKRRPRGGWRENESWRGWKKTMTGNKSSRGSDHPFTALVFIWIRGAAAAAAVMSLYEAQRAIQESIWMQMYYIMRRMHFCSRSKSSGLSTKKRSYSAKKKREKEIIIIFFQVSF